MSTPSSFLSPSSEGEPIQLFVYDLSRGMAKQWGQALTGRAIEGIWHTSLVLFGLEVFYGQGIYVSQTPGRTRHGTPDKKLLMGRTLLDKATFLEYIEGMKEVYRAEKYHLLDFNCNSFTNDVLGFLNGNSIPDDIRNLPRDILSTPFGQQMRPMIDQMFSGRSGPSPSSSSAVSSLLPSTTSNLQISTSVSSLRALVSSSDAVAVMFTRRGCAPCDSIKPYFEELAKEDEFGRVEFVLVETDTSGGGEIARGNEFGPVEATPGFAFFVRGGKVGGCVGAERGEVKVQLQLLMRELLGPPHPHTLLSLPTLSRLSKTLTPISYTTPPSYPQLLKKLSSFLLTSQMTCPALLPSTIQLLTSTIPTLLESKDSSIAEEVVAQWAKASNNAWECLEKKEHYPVVDLWRVGLVKEGRKEEEKLGLESTFVREVLPRVLEIRLPEEKEKGKEEPTKAEQLTLFKLLSNCLTSEVCLHSGYFLPSLISDATPSSSSSSATTSAVVKIFTEALLNSKDKGVRNCVAGFGWSLMGRWVARRTEVGEKEGEGEGGEWEFEILSALVEGVKTESENEITHKLIATIGILLYQSKNLENLAPLCEALKIGTALKELAEGKKEVVEGELKELVKEVGMMLS